MKTSKVKRKHFIFFVILVSTFQTLKASTIHGDSLPTSISGSIKGSTADINRQYLINDMDTIATAFENDLNLTPTGEEKINQNDEKRLLDLLMRGYDRTIRPVLNSSDAVLIQLGITLTQIFDMDEKNQVLTTNVWLDQEWYDKFLIWNPKDFNGLATIRLPCERIWIPDIVLYNSADDYTRGYMNSRAMVSYEGKVFWPPPTKFRSTCPVDVTYFPFDDQTCTLKLGSWIYDGFQVDVTNRTSLVDLTNYVSNGEWELLDATIIRNVIYYSCCPEPFPDVTIRLTIRRKTLYYMYNIVLPCMIMSVLTLLVFCLPPDSGEKIALGVTVLLAFSVFMLAIAEKMPETSESIPLIGIYLTAVMAITSVSIIMTVTVLNCHYRGPVEKEVPRWMKKYILDTGNVLELFTELFCKRSRSTKNPIRAPCRNRIHNNSNNLRHKPKSAINSSEENARSRFTSTSVNGDFPNNVKDHYFNKVQDAIRVHVEGVIGEDMIKDSYQTDFSSSLEDIHGLHAAYKDCNESAFRKIQNNSHSPISVGNLCYSRSQDEIVKLLRMLLQRHEKEDVEKKRLNEWQRVAIKIDQILFWIFLVVTTVSSVVFLVVLPFVKRASYVRPT